MVSVCDGEHVTVHSIADASRGCCTCTPAALESWVTLHN